MAAHGRSMGFTPSFLPKGTPHSLDLVPFGFEEIRGGRIVFITSARRLGRLAAVWALLLVVPGRATWAQTDQETAPARRGDSASIEQVLERQVAAWNRGDLDGFMAHYWRADDMTFSSGGTTERGWQATLDRYRRRYPDRESMGRLAFSDLEIHPLGEDAAYVLGRWTLRRHDSQRAGNFTLVLRRPQQDWVIVHDHTSQDAPSADAADQKRE